ncbi:hypothetical protein MGH68_18380 [Erysipelothrix sp. D19-032]
MRRERNGLLASLNSTAKLDYNCALDGISNTQTIAPISLGKSDSSVLQTYEASWMDTSHKEHITSMLTSSTIHC